MAEGAEEQAPLTKAAFFCIDIGMANIASVSRMKRCRWTKEQFLEAASKARSKRQLLTLLGLIPRGGNYATVDKYLEIFGIVIPHDTGKGWRKGSKIPVTPPAPLHEILVHGRHFQSHHLKMRLFTAGLKPRYCEACGWAQRSSDGRIPLELDHINGNRQDNRLQNLRILCPNCHSLTPTYRGLNKKKTCRGGEIGQPLET